MRRFFKIILLIVWVLLTPVLLYHTYELFYLVTVNTRCEQISFHHFEGNRTLHRKEVEKILKGFRAIENPKPDDLEDITKHYMEEHRKKGEEFTVVAYNKYVFFRGFEIIYSTEDKPMEILGPFD